MQIIRTFGHVFGGTLLVSGTSIGVGMLALPLATAEGGFFPSLVIYGLCWIFMLCTGLLVLEAAIWLPKDANLGTMASHLLGRSGKMVCWVLYIFLFTSLMVAHEAGGASVLKQLSGGNIPDWAGLLIYVAAFAPIVYLGTHSVDRLNLILMVGILFTYILFIVSSFHRIDFNLLAHTNWSKAWPALPVVFTAFGYQSLIPTLMTYMNRNVKKVRLAIILGTAIPFCIYIVWELVILGIVPAEGPGGLIETLHKGGNAVGPLGRYLQNPGLTSIGRAFAFFALTTSFVGISIAYIDYLADSLKIQKKGFKKLGLCAFVFVLPLIVTLINPHIFILALEYAGGYGVAILLGLMPILMVWSGRYYKGYMQTHRQLFGGKAFLSILIAFVIFELIVQLW